MNPETNTNFSKDAPLTIGVFEAVFPKMLQQLFEENFNRCFERNFLPAFDKAFDRKFQPAFDQSFEKSFEASFQKGIMQFYENIILPQYLKFKEFKKEMLKFRDVSYSRFDDLYHQLENLKQEYIVSNFQLKRLDRDKISRQEFYEELDKIKLKIEEKNHE